MTAEKFNATQGTASQPVSLRPNEHTEALRRMRDIIMATMTACTDTINRANSHQRWYLAEYWRGKSDGFASTLKLLKILGPQIEEEAIEMGIEHAQETVGEWNKPLGY